MLPNVVESDAFVYFDVEGFQPWVDTARERIEADHADDVALIDAAAGIELREYDDDHTHGHSHEHGHDDSLSIHVIALEDDHGHVVADAHGDHWHDVPLEVPVDETVEFTVHLETDDGEALSLADDDYTLESALEGDTNTLTVETSGERLEIDGQEDGNATVVLRVLEDGTSGGRPRRSRYRLAMAETTRTRTMVAMDTITTTPTATTTRSSSPTPSSPKTASGTSATH